MKNKLKLFIMIGIVTLFVCGCGNQEKLTPNNGEINIQPETEDAIEKTSEDVQEEVEQKEIAEIQEEHVLSFDEFVRQEFWFSSGAGGWATILNINKDGGFYGEFTDSEMESIGEDYPNGTVYRCDFTGHFTQPVRINDYTYSMQIEELNYKEEVGKEKILGGVRYCYSDAYGLEDAENILIYLPGAPLAELPEEFRIWVGFYDIEESGETELPFYALNNEAQQYGFTSYDIVENLNESLNFFAEEAEAIEDSIKNDPLTQAEYNEKTQELYKLWDAVLNDVWRVLKRTQDEDKMKTLTTEQREWIAMKEQTIAEIGAEYEGGSMQSMIMNQKAAELTKARVYELIELSE